MYYIFISTNVVMLPQLILLYKNKKYAYFFFFALRIRFSKHLMFRSLLYLLLNIWIFVVFKSRQKFSWRRKSYDQEDSEDVDWIAGLLTDHYVTLGSIMRIVIPWWYLKKLIRVISFIVLWHGDNSLEYIIFFWKFHFWFWLQSENQV